MSTLKLVDDQSLVALLAMRRALDEANGSIPDLADWGLVAAPRTLGRRKIADAIGKYRSQGAWSISPHLIPHVSLHSLAGLLSQGLRLHGPNFGAGGPKGSEAEAVRAAVALLVGEELPGVWIVFTGWDRELLVEGDGVCQAAVLGIRTQGEAESPCLLFDPNPVTTAMPRFTLESLGEAIRNRAKGSWHFGNGSVGINQNASIQEAAA
ncbi:MAG: hypothetical protein K8T89_09930 [Planctomycetes bacterium]|nr:hypothetical protein [Planctomycetota bacterium]